MDSISQAALGAAIGEVCLGKTTGYKGAIAGAVVATLPDLDVLLYLFYSKFEMLSIHRGFSHSLILGIIMPFLFVLLFRQFKWADHLSNLKIWIFTFLVYITHLILDTFTSYGTQLLMPFSDRRVGFDCINVVDPIYTIPLLIGLILSLFIYRNKNNRGLYNTIGIAVSTLYLISTFAMKTHINSKIEKELKVKGIEYNSLLSLPVGIGGINWYGIAGTEKGVYMKKFYLHKTNNSEFVYFNRNENLLDEINNEVVTLMKWFSKGNYTVSRSDGHIRFYNLQVDMRGIILNENVKAPTAGYFILYENDTKNISSGSHQIK